MERISDTIIKLPVQHNTDGTIFIDDKHKYSEEGYVPDWHLWKIILSRYRMVINCKLKEQIVYNFSSQGYLTSKVR